LRTAPNASARVQSPANRLASIAQHESSARAATMSTGESCHYLTRSAANCRNIPTELIEPVSGRTNGAGLCKGLLASTAAATALE
jgi:hypothetical protein